MPELSSNAQGILLRPLENGIFSVNNGSLFHFQFGSQKSICISTGAALFSVFGRMVRGADLIYWKKRTIKLESLLPPFTDWNWVKNSRSKPLVLADPLRRASGFQSKNTRQRGDIWQRDTLHFIPSPLLPHDAESTSSPLRKRRTESRTLLRPEKEPAAATVPTTIPVSFPAKPTTTILLASPANRTTTIPFSSQSCCAPRELLQSVASCTKVLPRTKSRPTNISPRLRSVCESTTTRSAASTSRRRRQTLGAGIGLRRQRFEPLRDRHPWCG
jgi:hypothetical protein